MLFPTPTYALLLLAVLGASTLLGGRPRAWRLMVVTASWVFYGYASARMLALLALLVAVTWGLGHLVGRDGRVGRLAFVAGLVLDLSLLALFKYYDFFVSSAADALQRTGLVMSPPLLEVALPVGLSFLTFQAVSYLVEVRRGVIPAASPLDVAVWLSFFPTVTAGPITRASELLPQLPRAGERRRVDTAEACWLLLRGLAKKAVLATWLTTAVTTEVLGAPSLHTGPELLLATYAYAAMLYLDFSGYTDMARGSALLLGVRLPENFRSPYRATSVHDFWQRWHISLSRWLRDFLFAPLTHWSRARWWRSAGVPVVVMALAGLWHGAAWTFVLFGLVHGVALAVERVAHERRRQQQRQRSTSPPRTLLAWFVTFHVVCLGWVFFSAGSVQHAWAVLAGLTGGWSVPPELPWLLAPVLLLVAVAQALPARVAERALRVAASTPAVARVVALAAGLVLVDALGPSGVAPFVYYRF